jgi:hypothetical protein
MNSMGKLDQVAKLMVFIQVVFDSNLGWDTGCPSCGLLSFSSVLLGKC